MSASTMGTVTARPRVSVPVGIAVSLLLLPGIASAQRVRLDAGVSTSLTWTSNAQLTADGTEDTILGVRPYVSLRAEGPRLKIFGSAAVSGLVYANGTLRNRAAPEADLGAEVELLERLLFLDAGLRAFQTSVDPLGPRAEAGGTTENSVTTAQARLSPRLEGRFGPDLRYAARSENTWTKEYGATAPGLAGATDGYFARHTVSMSRDPRPLGWHAEAQRTQTRYRDDTLRPLTLDVARLGVDYALDTDLTVSVHLGRERSDDLAADQDGNIVGFQVRWQPSPRTSFNAFEERRSFGNAWRLAFDHRAARWVWNALMSRTLSSTPQSVLDLPATDDLAGSLDAIFRSRYPNPADRAAAVQDYITRNGLPTSLLDPLTVRALGFNVVTLRRVGVTLIGVRNSLSLGLYKSRTEDTTAFNPIGGGTAGLAALDQYGASVALSHRLSPVMVLATSGEWTRVRRADQQSIQRTARLRLNVEASPRTTAFAGLRYRELGSDVVSAGREGAVFAGLDHRF